MSRKDRLNKLYQKISKAKYEMELSWRDIIENNAISDTRSPQLEVHMVKLAYYNGLIESIRTLGFEEHFIEWQKDIEDNLPF